jgi:hypothetical protein
LDRRGQCRADEAWQAELAETAPQPCHAAGRLSQFGAAFIKFGSEGGRTASIELWGCIDFPIPSTGA